MAEDTAEGLREAIRVDTAELRGHVDEVMRSSYTADQQPFAAITAQS